MNSVVHTGVKSAGWENSTTHLPLEVMSLSFNMPCVVLASKSGATSLMRGILDSVIFLRKIPVMLARKTRRGGRLKRSADTLRYTGASDFSASGGRYGPQAKVGIRYDPAQIFLRATRRFHI